MDQKNINKSIVSRQEADFFGPFMCHIRHISKDVIESEEAVFLAAFIPKFKNTGEALRYGQENKGNQKIINALRWARKAYLVVIRFLYFIGQENTAFYLASGQSQLVREALEAATR